MAQTSRLVLEIDSRDAEQKIVDTRKALESLEEAGIRVKPALDKTGQGMTGMAGSSEKATRSVKEQKDEIAELLGRIDPLTKKLGELDKQEAALAKSRKANKIDLDTYNEYQAKIAATRSELTRFGDSLNRTGNTAKQTAAALRGVPAQFTDIAVSLQGGQAPLTVFLQQGGQLKDMFGGVGPAAKALGGYIVGLINPFTVLAATLGSLAAVYYDAEKEASAFNKALFSGSASSGQTAGTLSAIAKSTAGITGSLGEAKAAVIALAASSGLSEVQFRNLAEASASIGEFTGKSAGDVAKSLGDMGDNATKAAEKISAQYGLLTSAQYEVIKGLDDQGKKQEALDLLSETLNQNAKARLNRYRESLSDIERDWNDIGTAISNAYSRVRGELFPDSAKQIEIIERILKTRKDGGLAGAVSTGLSKLNGALGLDDGNNDDSTAALEKRLALLKQTAEVAKSTAELDGKTTRENQARIEADTKWSALSNKELSDQAKLVKDIADARRLGVEAGKSQAEIDKVVGDIQAKYDKAQPKTPKAKAYTEDAGIKALDQAKQQYAVLQQQSVQINLQQGSSERLGAAAQALIKWEQQLSDIKEKKTLTADQKSLLANQELVTAQLKRNAGLEKENQLTSARLENAAKLKAYQDGLNAELALAQEGLDNRNAGTGLGDRTKARLQEELKIRQDYQKKINKLTTDYSDSTDKSAGRKSLYEDDLEAAQNAMDKRLAMQQNSYVQEEELRNNWLAGTSTAWENYLDIATNYNQQAQDSIGQVLGDTTSSISDQIQGLVKGTTDLGDAFVNLATTMAGSVLRAISDIAAQWAVTQALKMAGITAETTATVTSEGVKTAAKVTGDTVATGSTLAALATTTAATVAAAGTTLASWLPAALVASVGSFGAAAIVGGAGLLAAFALIKGFSAGGYTGAGGVNDPAGIVHKGEVVWSQDDIKRSGGVASVEALRKGNVSPIRAAMKGSGASSGAAGLAPATSSGSTVVNLNEDASRAGQVQTSTGPDGKQIMEIFVSNIRSQSSAIKAFEQTYGLKRVGR